MKKWQIVDLVRSFCIVAAMAVHNYSNIPFSHRWASWLWGRFCFNGIYGVFVFFIVSGFLITHVIDQAPGGLFEPKILRFYVNRAGRIWPLFFLCVGLQALLFVFGDKNSPIFTACFSKEGDYGAGFWLSIPTFLFNWFLVLKPSWDYTAQWMILWSISIEEQFYFFYPIVLRKIKNGKNLSALLFLMIFGGVVWRLVFYFYCADNGFIQTYASPGKFDLVAVGILIYLVYKSSSGYFSRNRMVSLLVCAAGIVLTGFVYFFTRANDRFSEIFTPDLFGLGLSGILLGGIHLPFWESKYLRAASLPGKYCYGCYLLHPWIFIYARPFFSKLNFLAAYFLLVATVTVVAVVSFHCFEAPVNRWVRKTFGG